MLNLQEVYALETLTELEDWCAAQCPSILVETLHNGLDARLKYETAQEWNELVRIVECLNISGWAKRKPLETVLFRSVYYPLTTWLADDRGNKLHREGQWLKRKHGVYLREWKDYSADGTPGDLKKAEEGKIRFEGHWPKRARNRLPSSPIRLVLCGASDDDISLRTEAIIERFHDILKDIVNPTPHWHYLQDMRVFYHVGRYKSYRGTVKVGPFRRKQCAVWTDFSVKQKFMVMSPEEQKRYLAAPLIDTIESLRPKLKKTGTPSDLDRLLSEVDLAFQRLLGETIVSRERPDLEIMLMGLSEHIDGMGDVK